MSKVSKQRLIPVYLLLRRHELYPPYLMACIQHIIARSG